MNLQRGASIIENIVASAILALALAGALLSTQFIVGMTTKNDSETIAYQIARNAIEELRMQGWENVRVVVNPNTKLGEFPIYPQFVDANGANLTRDPKAPTNRYRIDAAITDTTAKVTLPDGQQTAGPFSLETVQVTVTDLKVNKVVATYATTMTRSGI